jgi:hypothetical protein
MNTARTILITGASGNADIYGLSVIAGRIGWGQDGENRPATLPPDRARGSGRCGSPIVTSVSCWNAV